MNGIKKLISVAITAVTFICVAAVPISANAAAMEYKIDDVTNIQRAVGGFLTLTTEQTKNYDINSDGKVTIADATWIQQYLAGQITTTPKDTPKSISLNKSTLELGAGEKYTLVVSADITDYNKYFTSSDSYVAKVGSDGTIEAVGTGTATITLRTDNNLTATCKVTVKKMAESVSLNATSLTLGVGETYDLNSYISDDTYAYFRWYTSDNANIAPVEKSGGLVTAKKVGTSKIICTLYNGVTATCKVTIKDAPTSISFHQGTSATLKVGNTYTLSEHTNANSYASVFNFKSSNSSVVAISRSYGNKIDVIAKRQGTANITVSTYNNKTATFKITVSGSNAKCLDISEWQGYVDYSQVKAAGYNYVILRAGYGRENYQIDARFEQNYTNAKNAGLKVGVYWFSYAMSPYEAELEANACLYILNNRQLDMPVYYDMEYGPAITGLSKNTLTNIANSFCSKVGKVYDSGIYSSASVFDYSINYDELIANSYSIWNAEWSNYTTIGCDIWQYTDTAKVNGINGYVDCSYIYNLNIAK